MITTDPPPSLSDELRAVEAGHPGWHCWTGNTGRCHATTCQCAYPDGCGTTVEARTPDLLHHAIAEVVHDWAVSGAGA
jgi:hypothetical protein